MKTLLTTTMVLGLVAMFGQAAKAANGDSPSYQQAQYESQLYQDDMRCPRGYHWMCGYIESPHCRCVSY